MAKGVARKMDMYAQISERVIDVEIHWVCMSTACSLFYSTFPQEGIVVNMYSLTHRVPVEVCSMCLHELLMEAYLF